MDTRPEQRLLQLSIGVTVVVGVVGLVGGLLSNSGAIVFDGIYSMVDVLLTVAALAVSRLVPTQGSRRFQYGYWHLEPMVETFGGATLAIACGYAGIDAIEGLLGGGHETAFGLGMASGGVIAVAGLGMSAFMRHQAKRHASALLALDARAWLVSGSLSVTLIIGFGIALWMRGTPYAHLIPYVDPAVLLGIAAVTLPVPLLGTVRAVREILQVAPGDLDNRVRTVMDAVLVEHGFLDYSSYVAKTGRVRFIEIHVLVPTDYQLGPITRADEIRRDIAGRLGAQGHEAWLTIDFTADRAWI
jgi:predicted Co/Zn/Cd cation transporter (cation efflux family)